MIINCNGFLESNVIVEKLWIDWKMFREKSGIQTESVNIMFCTTL